MRATLRAVFADRRKPRPTPAAKLSGFLGFLRRAVMGLAPTIAVTLRSCHRSPNHPPRADRLQESWSSRVCTDAGHRTAQRYDRLVLRGWRRDSTPIEEKRVEGRQWRLNSPAHSIPLFAWHTASRSRCFRRRSPLLPPLNGRVRAAPGALQ